MGDPVGNFHYVEERLKEGITVSRGGEGWPRTETQKKPLQDVEMVLYIMSPRKREKKNSHPYSNNNTAMVYYNGK